MISEEHALGFLDLLYFLSSISLIYAVLFSTDYLGFNLLLMFLSLKVRTLIIDFRSSFIIYALSAINFCAFLPLYIKTFVNFSFLLRENIFYFLEIFFYDLCVIYMGVVSFPSILGLCSYLFVIDF